MPQKKADLVAGLCILLDAVLITPNMQTKILFKNSLHKKKGELG